jgi:CHRD domain/VPDSG-CTERM motif
LSTTAEISRVLQYHQIPPPTQKKNMKTLHISLLALSIVIIRSQSFADTILSANITHDQEVGSGALPLTTSTGAPRPLSFGTATFTLNAAQTELAFTATIFNIDITGTQTADTFDDLMAAHIHVGAPPGANAPVRFGFFGTPDNDINPDNLVITPFASGVGGTFSTIWNQPEGNAGTTLTTNLPEILAGNSYINFHTVQFAGGEIRGQIGAVPDAGSTATMLTFALAGIIGLQWRKRQMRASA